MKIFPFVPIKLKNLKLSKHDLPYFLIHFTSKYQVRLDPNQLYIPIISTWKEIFHVYTYSSVKQKTPIKKPSQSTSPNDKQ